MNEEGVTLELLLEEYSKRFKQPYPIFELGYDELEYNIEMCLRMNQRIDEIYPDILNNEDNVKY